MTASLRSWGTTPCYEHLVKRSWSLLSRTSPLCLYTSAGMPSIQHSIQDFSREIAYWISSQVGGVSSLLLTSLEGSFPRMLAQHCWSLKRPAKCSDQWFMMSSLLVRRDVPSEEHSGAWIWCDEGQKGSYVPHICEAKAVHQLFCMDRRLAWTLLQAFLQADLVEGSFGFARSWL